MRKIPNTQGYGTIKPPPPPTPPHPKKRGCELYVNIRVEHDKTILADCLLFLNDLKRHGSFYNSAIELDQNLSGDYCEKEVERLSAIIKKALSK